MNSLESQLTPRGLIIGVVGCVIITAASAYTALKMGALPWPIVFAAVISLFFLRGTSRGTATLNEANVTHTIMSAGAMVAGGLAFTIPALWMLGLADETDWLRILAVALCGVILGLVCTAVLRKHFIEDAELTYPIGEAAAQALKAGDSGGRVGAQLFGAIGFAGAYTAVRDWLGLLPKMFLSNVSVPGVSFGIYNSPMMAAVGFMVGTGAAIVWFAGALIGNFGIIVGGPALGVVDLASAQGITSSLGMGLMMGAGIGVVLKNILPKAVRMMRSRASGKTRASGGRTCADGAGEDGAAPAPGERKLPRWVTPGLAGLGTASVLLLGCIVLGLSPLVCVAVVALGFVTCAMSAQSVGQTGIDPMEIFGLIVLLVIAAASSEPLVQLLFVAGIVAVACGLTGDVMNDFHAGHMLGTSPRAQFVGQAIGAIVGALIAAAMMSLLVNAYGPEAFGPSSTFVSAQASVVATMISGVPSVGAFAVGLAAGCALYFANFPAMMLGLGVYLPFYMSFTAFLGAMAKLLFDAAAKRRAQKRGRDLPERHGETGLVIASGMLGGESIVGTITAIIAVATGGVL